MSDDHEFDDLVTIARFSFPYQAYLLRGRLESEGIEAFIQQEDNTSVMPYLAMTKSGICVQVKQSEAEAALAIVKLIEDSVTPSSELHEALDIDGKVFDLVKGVCPECEKASVYLARSGGAAATGAVAFVLSFGIPIKLEHKYFCYSCHYEWNG